ncbi:MAG: TraR/DksA C4-type zinc finger protein [Sporomusaceae bacterium]|nr:TraR/DksA C4-type zinc finger protein [Sporomusaceae bacterium]
MDELTLAQAAARLRAEKQKRLAVINNLEENGLDQDLGNSSGELSVYDNHPADIGSEVFERGKDIALRDNEQILISEMDRALAKIEAGSYGVCDLCGRQIPQERLHSLPWATTCIQCQRQEERSDAAARPLEETSLAVPFSRTFLDTDADGDTGFDGEDSLEAVWRYGSSDSPQDLPGCHDYRSLDADSEASAGIVEPTDQLAAHIDGSYDQSESINRDSGRHKFAD